MRAKRARAFDMKIHYHNRSRLPAEREQGATETVLLTAALADGRTILENAATEPEVVELALLLQRMGARIELQPDRRFVVYSHEDRVSMP